MPSNRLANGNRAVGPSRFALVFPPNLIGDLAAAHYDEREDRAFAAGSRIASGSRNLEDLSHIIEWKTRGRGRSRILKNSNSEIEDALHLAVAARTERAAIAVLRGLIGVDIPVASAILTAIMPTRYTVIDFRALFSLGSAAGIYSVSFYLEYLNACRFIANDAEVTLRTLDKALWQYSKDEQDPQQR